MYHVIVVTQLFYFKTPNKHKESDVVQFMVSVKTNLSSPTTVKPLLNGNLGNRGKWSLWRGGHYGDVVLGSAAFLSLKNAHCSMSIPNTMKVYQ